MSDTKLKWLNPRMPKTKEERDTWLKTFETLVRVGRIDLLDDHVLTYVAEGVRQSLNGQRPWQLPHGKAPKGDMRQQAFVVFHAHILPLWRPIFEDAKPLPASRFTQGLENHRAVRRMLERAIKNDEHLMALHPFIDVLAEEHGLPPGTPFSLDGQIHWLPLGQWPFYRQEQAQMYEWVQQRIEMAKRLLAEGNEEEAFCLASRQLMNLDWVIETQRRRREMHDDDACRAHFEATIGVHVNVLNSNPLAPPSKNVRSEQQRWFELMFYTPIPLPCPDVRT